MRLNHIYLFGLFILLNACNGGHGCTTSKVIDSRSRSIDLGKYQIKVECKQIEFRHSRRKPFSQRRHLFDRDVSYSYGIQWGVQTNFWSQDDVAFDGSGEDVDLDKEMKRFNLRISKNGKHTAYGVDNSLVAVVHIYKGRGFMTQDYYEGDQELFKLTEFNLDQFKDPEILIAEIFEKGRMCSVIDDKSKKNIAAIIHSLPDDHKLAQLAFRMWPECQISKDIFTAAKIQEKVKSSPKFKKTVINKIATTLEDNESGFDQKDMLELVVRLDDQEIYEAVDGIVASNWGDLGIQWGVDEYLDKRWANQSTPISEENEKKFTAKAMEILDGLVNRSNSSSGDMEKAMKYLIKRDKPKEIDYLLEKSFTRQNMNNNYFDLKRMYLNNFEIFSEEDKTKILDGFYKGFEYVPYYRRDMLYGDLKKFLNCDQIKALIEKYPKQLGEETLPYRCTDS